MTTCLLYYGTSEGQTAKIALRIRDRLVERGITVDVIESPASAPVDSSRYDAVLIGDSIHAGHYHRPVLKYIREYRDALRTLPTGFFSVCLSASSPEPKQQEQAKAFVDGMIDATQWRPDCVGIFAGALQYSKYGLIKRWMMRKISASDGRETDTAHDYEYTNWNNVDAFAEAFADHLGSRPEPVATPA